jgi:hypothetical protein
MDPALVSCCACSRTWHSRTMAEGLRTIGSCPRCGGTLAWADGLPDGGSDGIPARAGLRAPVAPHLVLGLPRR